MYKLIAIDIDGTLLNHQKELTTVTREAIKHLKKTGMHIVLCTGRPIQGILPLYEELKLDGPIVTYNGAEVFLKAGQPPIYQQSLTPEDTTKIIQWGQNLQTTLVVWYRSQLYANQIDLRAKEYSSMTSIEPKLIKGNEDFFQQGATKVLYYNDVKKIQEYLGDLKDKISDKVSMHTSLPYFLEFVHADVSKSNALEKLGQHLDVSQHEMVAVGDGFNDLSMIEYAGLGVAMENAPKEVKEKADVVTRSCEQDGLAYAIENFILTKL